MTTAAGQNILALVNEKLDPDQILQLIGWRPEKARNVGSALNGFCPLHKGSFSTLIIDRRRRTFICSYRDCRGHDGGTLLELWAAVHKIEPVRAALELCERLHLQVDGPTRAILSAYLFDGAEVAYVKRHLPEAEQLAERALALTPDYADARLLLAKVRFDQNDAASAKREYLTLAAALEKRGDLRRAREAYERILQFDPQCPDTRERLARVHRASGNTAQALEIYQALAADSAARSDRRGRALWLERILETDDSLTQIRGELAGLLIEDNRTDEGLTQLRMMAEQLRLAGQAGEAAGVMERIARLRPDELEAREAQAALTLESGDIIAARQLYAALVEEYLAKENWEGAQACLTQLVETDPDDMEARRRLARIHESLGAWAPAIALYRVIASATLKIGDAASAIDALQRLIDLDKDNLAYRSDLAEALAKAGRLEHALEQYQVIAQRQFERGQRDEGFHTCRHIAALSSGLLEPRLKVARLYAQYGLKPQAIEEFQEIAQAASQQGDTRAQAQACEEGLALAPGTLSLMELRYEAARDTKPPDAAQIVELGKRLIGRLLAEGICAKAEDTIAECLAFAPEDHELRRMMFDLCAQLDRQGDCYKQVQALDSLLAANGETAELTQIYQRFLALAPNHTEARRRLTALYQESGDTSRVIESLREQVNQRFQAGDFAGARQAVERLLELIPDDPQALWQIAEVAAETESFAAAVPRYLSALNVLKGSRSPEEMRAAYAQLQQREAANRDVRRAHAEYLDSLGDAAAAQTEYRKLAAACAEAGDEAAALAALQRLIQLEPEDRAAGGQAIDLLRRSGQNKEAAAQCLRLADLCRSAADAVPEEGYLRQARELAPDDVACGQRLARLLAGRGAATEARDLLLALCDGLEKAQEWPQMLEACETGLELLKQEAGLFARRARALQGLGRAEQAAADYKALACLNEEAGNGKEAQEAWLVALQLAPGDVECLERIAEGCQRAGEDEKACEYLRSLSEQWLARQQPDKAAQATRRILEIHPDDVAARERLAGFLGQMNQAQMAIEEQMKVCDLYVQQGQCERALAVLEPLVRQYPEHVKARARLIDLLQDAGQAAPAGAHCMELCRLLEGQEAKDEALVWARRAAQVAPDSVEAIQAQAQLLLALDRKQEAGDCLRALVQIFEKRKDFDQALSCLRQLSGLDPDNPALREQTAALLDKAGRREEAVAEWLVAADIYAEGSNAAEERRALEAALSLAPEQRRALERLGQLSLESGASSEAAFYWMRLAQTLHSAKDLPGALAILRRVLEVAPALLDAYERMADVFEQMGQAATAAERCLAIADIYAAGGKAPQDTQSMLERAKRLQPGNGEIRRRLLTFLFGQNRLEEAAAECMDACQMALVQGDKAMAESLAEMAQPLAFDTRLTLARMLFDGGCRDKARAQLRGLMQGLEDQRQWAKILEVGRLAGDRMLEEEESGARRYRAYRELGQTQEAADTAKKLAELARAQGKAGETLAWRREAVQLAPEDAEGLAALAGHYQELGQTKDACGYWLQLSAVHEKRKAWEQALECMNRACSCDAKDLALREQRAALLGRAGKSNERIQELLVLARAHIAQGDAAQGRRIYERLLADHPDHLQALEALAQLLIDSGQSAEACERLLDLADRQSAAGDWSSAVMTLRQAAQIAPQNIGAQERLADLLEQLRDSGASAQFLTLCELYFEAKAPRKAIAALGRAKRFQASNHDVRMRLVDLLMAENQRDQAVFEALDACREALGRGNKELAKSWSERIARMAPDAAASRLAAARLLLESQCHEEAQQAVHAVLQYLEEGADWAALLEACRLAEELLPEDIVILASRRTAHSRLNQKAPAIAEGAKLAGRLRALGRLPEALALYREILTLAPDNAVCLDAAAQLLQDSGQKAEASQYLQQLAAIHERGGALEAALACWRRACECEPDNLTLREQRAAALSRGGRAADRTEELLALARERAKRGESGEARRLYESLLAEMPDHLGALEELAQILAAGGETKAAAERWMDLAQRRSDAGEAAGAIAALDRLLAIEPENMDALERKAKGLERLGDLGPAAAIYLRLCDWHCGRQALPEAIACARRARTLAPDDLSIRLRLIELAQSAGLVDEAAAESLEACRLAFEAGQNPLALEFAARVSLLAPNSIESRLAVARLLGAHGRARDAKDAVRALMAHLTKIQSWEGVLPVCALAQEHDTEESEVLQSRFAAHRALGHEREALIDGKRLARLRRSQGNAAQAIAIYEELLTMSPKDVECLELMAGALEESGEADAPARAAGCLLRLSEIFEDESDYDQAIACRRRALEKTPGRPEAHLELADLYDRVERGAERIEEMLAAARLYAAQGKNARSRDIYEQVLRKSRDNRAALAELADVCLAEGDATRACALMTLLSDQHRAEGQWDAAAKILQHAISLSPENIAFHERLAALFEEEGDQTSAAGEHLQICELQCKLKAIPQAVKALRRVKQLQPDNWDACSRLAELLEQEGMADEAAAEFLEVCRGLLAAGHSSEALESARRIVGLAPRIISLRLDAVRLLVDHGIGEEAHKDILALIRQLAGAQRWENALTVCREAAGLFPEDTEALSLAIETNRHLGRTSDAMSGYRKLVARLRDKGDNAAAMEVCRKAMDLAPEDEDCWAATVEIARFVQRPVEAAEALRRLSALAERRSDFDQAVRFLREALEAEPARAGAQMELADLYGRAGMLEQQCDEWLRAARAERDKGAAAEARRIYDLILEQLPDHVESLSEMAELCQGAGDAAGAGECWLKLAGVLRSGPDPARAVSPMRLAIEANPANIEARTRLATLLVETGQREAAAEEWSGLADLLEEQVKPGASATAQGRSVSAYWTRALELAPRRDDLRLRRAAALEREQSWDAAASEYLMLAGKRGERRDHAGAIEYCRKVAAIAEKARMPELAQECHSLMFESFVALGETAPAIEEIIWLSSAQQAKGRRAEADKLIARGLKMAPDHPRLLVKQGEALLEMKRKGEAIQLFQRALAAYEKAGDEKNRISVFKKILEQDSRNVTIQSNLVDVLLATDRIPEAMEQGWLLAEQLISRGYLDRAESAYRRIVKWAPDDIRAWQRLIETHLQIGPEEDLSADYMTLAEVYMKAEKISEAVKTLRRVVEMEPANVAARRRYVELYPQIGPEADLIDDYLCLAQACHRAGELGEARQWYQSALRLDPSNAAAAEFMQRVPEHAEDSSRAARLGETPGKAGTAARPETLSKRVESYLNVLKVNPDAYDSRMRLAELYDQLGQEDEAFEHWRLASETLMQRGETLRAVEILERLR
ncbi:MAG: tetratricopeptide repeat protein [Candidatus Sumerlaeota bacterium]|nr:tetratricopeptide repeat protein [Candidatus Sumerlaeota bacterium]